MRGKRSTRSATASEPGIAMKMVLWCLGALALATASVLSSAADDVPTLVRRYQAVRGKLLKLGYRKPTRIAEALAPRFIQYSDWVPRKQDPRIQYNPWFVYCPSPTTWEAWEKGNALVTRQAQADYAS